MMITDVDIQRRYNRLIRYFTDAEIKQAGLDDVGFRNANIIMVVNDRKYILNRLAIQYHVKPPYPDRLKLIAHKVTIMTLKEYGLYRFNDIIPFYQAVNIDAEVERYIEALPYYNRREYRLYLKEPDKIKSRIRTRLLKEQAGRDYKRWLRWYELWASAQ